MSEYILENIKFRKAVIQDCIELSYLKKEIYENTFRGIYPNKLIDDYDFDANVSKFESFVKSE